jgi:fructose/tagatose bisphosphate aldolase
MNSPIHAITDVALVLHKDSGISAQNVKGSIKIGNLKNKSSGNQEYFLLQI